MRFRCSFAQLVDFNLVHAQERMFERKSISEIAVRPFFHFVHIKWRDVLLESSKGGKSDGEGVLPAALTLGHYLTPSETRILDSQQNL